jgi:hypothetical protein
MLSIMKRQCGVPDNFLTHLNRDSTFVHPSRLLITTYKTLVFLNKMTHFRHSAALYYP